MGSQGCHTDIQEKVRKTRAICGTIQITFKKYNKKNGNENETVLSN